MTMPATLRFLTAAALCIAVHATPAEAKPRGPSAQQTKKMKEMMEWQQKEMQRYQTEMAAKQREIAQSFDANGDGRLDSVENAKYTHHLDDIQAGKVANPFSGIKPPGQGPKPAKGK